MAGAAWTGNSIGRPPASESYIEQVKAERAKRARDLAKRLVEAGLDPDSNKAVKAQQFMSHTLDGLPKQTLVIQQENDPSVNWVLDAMIRRLGMEAQTVESSLQPVESSLQLTPPAAETS